MNYEQTLDFLYTQLPMYQRVGQSAYKKDLTNILALCRYLGKPELKFKSIHVAGTNGKGSTSHILSAIYQANGYKVGLYTSPHLLDFRERIKINGQMVSESFVVDFVKRIRPIMEEIKPSFFEITVAMAFDYFAQMEVDFAVIETGLGGRLDSTNIIIPELSVITSIGMDHMDMLGDTIEAIAGEKAGIIKPGVPVVCGLLPDAAMKVIKSVAKQKGCVCLEAIRIPHKFTASGLVSTDLLGAYQQINIKTALIAVDELKETWPTQDELIRAALLNVCKYSSFRGRWETISEDPWILCDVGHNVEGLTSNLNQLEDTGLRVHFILGFVSDKDLRAIVELFPKGSSYGFVKPNVIRGLDANATRDQFAAGGIEGLAFGDLEEALEQAVEFTNEDQCDIIYVGGSNFVVADLLDLQRKNRIPN